MSGAGRSTVGNVMEDHGWYVIDNLPVTLLPDLLRLSSERAQDLAASGQPVRVGIVLDVRAQGFDTLTAALATLRDRGWLTHLLFLEATNESLVRRFESVRRPHPLQGTGRLLDAIVKEREVLADVRATAETVVDTSGLNVHQLSRKISPIFQGETSERLRLAVLSFGFKYGVPLDADFVFDMRFLPNPYWVPELRAHTGRETQVSEYVLSQPGAMEFIESVDVLLAPVIAGYLRENRRYVTLAVGCTGGKHRSVAVAEALATRLASSDVATFVVHRDLGQE
ncbi:RNase adapter RapZ [Janibacter sp. YB324]|nr:RNase adapter RapZ [Janibacter sp. YB324]